MNCEQANGVDMIKFLSDCDLVPVRIRNANYWYHSPLHSDKTPSFKVNASKNTWYDFGIGKGGTLIDFVCILRQVNVSQALEIIAARNQLPVINISRQNISENNDDSKLIILEESPLIANMHLRQYLRDRKILPIVYQQYCKQIKYCIGENHFTAIGFKNKMGGYELRSPNFKCSSSPKFVSWIDNGSQTVQIFEGFFDFLAWQSMLQKHAIHIEESKSNFLILNSLSFFTRSLLLMEKHDRINLWLDNDKTGDEFTKKLKGRTNKVVDKRIVYAGYKDLSDWWVRYSQIFKRNKGLRL